MKLPQSCRACALWLRGASAGPSARPAAFPGIIAQQRPAPASRASQRRAYAAPQRPRRIKKQYYDDSLVNSIPQRIFAAALQRSFAVHFESTSPVEYYTCFRDFCGAMKESDADPALAARKLERAGTSAELLYEMGCLLAAESKTFASLDSWAVAASMGSRRATLALVQMLIKVGHYEKAQINKPVESKFKQIVAAGKDPNALTLQGAHLVLSEKYEAAVKVLRMALETPEFEWRESCWAFLGRAYARLGRRDDALRALPDDTILDDAFSQAGVERAKLLRDTDVDEAERQLWRAAYGGYEAAFTNLAEIFMERSANATDKKAAEEHLRTALECSRLADSDAEY